MLSMLGIRQLAVLVNKMDLVGYQQAVFERIVAEYGAFLDRVGLVPAGSSRSAARDGDNIATASRRAGLVLGADGARCARRVPKRDRARPSAASACRFRTSTSSPEHGDDRRIVAGTVESGSLRVGDDVVFYPSGKKRRVKTARGLQLPALGDGIAGQAVGFTLAEQIYVTRGEIATRAGQPRPQVSTRLRVSLFWLGTEPLETGREYLLKAGDRTGDVPGRADPPSPRCRRSSPTRSTARTSIGTRSRNARSS